MQVLKFFLILIPCLAIGACQRPTPEILEVEALSEESFTVPSGNSSPSSGTSPLHPLPVERDSVESGLVESIRSVRDEAQTQMTDDIEVAMPSGNISIPLGNDSPTGSPQATSGQGSPTITRPLPHKGLFVRRNNQFGTSSIIGIRDLIEQGVLIEEQDIRFDDFVASNREKIPIPDRRQSLKASYGLTPTNGQGIDNEATHYLEIALKATDKLPYGFNEKKTLGVNYILAIDVSSSMEGGKLNSAKASIRRLLQVLEPDDIIGIIAFNQEARTVLSATPVKELQEDVLSQTLSHLTSSGGTDINLGLSFAIDELDRYSSGNHLNQIYLFSDGNPTSGVTSWLDIRKNLAKKTKANLRLSTFGFGTDANMYELNALSGATGGKATFIDDVNDIHLSLQEDAHRRKYLAAVNLQIKISIPEEIKILYLYGHDLISDPVAKETVLADVKAIEAKIQEGGVTPNQNIITDKDGIRIFVPDLAVGDTYWIVFEVAAPQNQQNFGTTRVQYFDALRKKNGKEQHLELARRGGGQIAPNVVVEDALGLRTSEVIFWALNNLRQKNKAASVAQLTNHIATMTDLNKDLNSQQLQDDIITLRKFITLASNLGRPLTVSDSAPAPPQGYLNYKMNEYAEVRGGISSSFKYVRQVTE